MLSWTGIWPGEPFCRFGGYVKSRRFDAFFSTFLHRQENDDFGPFRATL
jgi:hypothetical protein